MSTSRFKRAEEDEDGANKQRKREREREVAFSTGSVFFEMEDLALKLDFVTQQQFQRDNWNNVLHLFVLNILNI